MFAPSSQYLGKTISLQSIGARDYSTRTHASWKSSGLTLTGGSALQNDASASAAADATRECPCSALFDRATMRTGVSSMCGGQLLLGQKLANVIFEPIRKCDDTNKKMGCPLPVETHEA